MLLQLLRWLSPVPVCQQQKQEQDWRKCLGCQLLQRQGPSGQVRLQVPGVLWPLLQLLLRHLQHQQLPHRP